MMKILQEKIICYFPPPVGKTKKKITIEIPAGELGVRWTINKDNEIVIIEIVATDSLLKVDDVIETLDKQILQPDRNTVERMFHASSFKKKRKLTIFRLVETGRMNKKKNQWRNSKAKEILLEGLMNGEIPLTKEELSAEEVYRLHPEFQEYPYTNFRTNLNSLRKDVRDQKVKTFQDEEALEHDRNLTSRNITQRGYQFWPKAKARDLLVQDLMEGKHERMKPIDLYST